jgi:hypothetical protein
MKAHTKWASYFHQSAYIKVLEISFCTVYLKLNLPKLYPDESKNNFKYILEISCHSRETLEILEGKGIMVIIE